MTSWPTDPRLVETVCRLMGDPDAVKSVTATVDALNLYPKTQVKLLNYLDDNADALVSGRSDGPASRLLLLRALTARYPGRVVAARCSQCGRQVPLNRWGADGERICGTCYLANRLVPCGRCGHVKPVAGRHSTDGLVCAACIRHDPARREQCSKCGRVHPVAARTPDGRPLCQTCRPRNTFLCVGCGRTHTVKSLRVEGGALCWACYKRQHKQACSQCGREHSQVPRRGPQGERLCNRCWDPEPVSCRDCGKPTSPKVRRVNGSHLCYGCYVLSRPQRACGVCGRTSPVWAELPLGPVCNGCYQQIRTKPQPCSGCGENRPLVGVSRDDHRICGACAGQRSPWTCHNCGVLAAPYSRGRCPRCTAREELMAVISRDGEIIRTLLPLMDYFDVENRPMTAIGWTRSRSAAILRRLVQASNVSHEALDVERNAPAANFLRALLVFTGALPARASDLDDTIEWLDQRVSVRPRHQTIVRRYAVWHVLRRAKRRRHRPATRHHARERLLLALRLLAWLEADGHDIEELSQADFDRWLAGGPPARAEIRDFIRWAQRQGLVGDLRVPLRRHSQPSDFLSTDQRWEALHRCIVDTALPLNVRVAGALLLLFGLGPTALTTMKVEQVVEHDDGVELLVGRTPIRLPHSVADLVLQQRKADDESMTGWLFPGQHPGRHLNPGSLAARIKQCLGIGVRPSRNAALAHLAKELPVPVLADYLGLAHTTASQWAGLVERQWGEYIVQRRS